MVFRYQWDPAKAADNIAKHDGVSFEQARKVFDDPLAIETADRSERYGEERFTTLGMAGDQLLIVAYTERTERDDHDAEVEIIRIISARKASRRERKRYHEA